MRRTVVAGAVAALGVVVAVVAVRGRQHDDTSQFENSCAASGIEVPTPLQLPSSFPLPPGTRITLTSVSAAGAVLALPGCSTAVVLTLRFRP